jgi:hypothetical protein
MVVVDDAGALDGEDLAALAVGRVGDAHGRSRAS